MVHNGPMDKLTAMQTFRAVVEHGSFAAAADARSLSRSAVSKHVAQLEAALGTQLLNRTTRTVALSPAGRRYHQRISAILDELDNVEREARDEGAVVRGRLRVAAPLTLGVKVLAPALPTFLRRHPAVELDLQLSDRYIDVVEEGVDVVIRVSARLEDSSLICRRLGGMSRVVVASPDYIARRGAPSGLSALSGHDCLLYTRIKHPEVWDFAEGSVTVSGPMRADNSIALIEAARAGVGLLLTPLFFVEADLAAGRLVLAMPHSPAAGRSVYAIYPSSRHFSAKARAFSSFAHEVFQRGSAS